MDVSDRKVSVGEGLRESEKGMKNVVVCVCVCVYERGREIERAPNSKIKQICETGKILKAIMHFLKISLNWKKFSAISKFFSNEKLNPK